ncbi:MAG: hypothetical protein Q4F51_09245 [Sarcina sp.]|nr:hypothetical protein [Sarcina sp.]
MSVKPETTEDAFAEKRARRRKPFAFPVLLLFSVLFLVLGAALVFLLFFPFRYSDREVDEYVHSIYGDNWSLSEKTASFDREGGSAQYVYEDQNGNSFSVFSFSNQILKNGIPTGRYRKALTDNYFSTVIEEHLDELKKLGKKARKKSGPVLEIEETGPGMENEDEGFKENLCGTQYIFRLYLEDRDSFAKAAELLEKMDKLLGFSCREAEVTYAQLRPSTPFVRIYLKPDKTRVEEAADAISSAAGSRQTGDLFSKGQDLVQEDEWKSSTGRSSYEISRISFSDGSFPPLSADRLLVRLENDFVDAAKTFGRSYYYISEKLWNKYPSPVLTLINAGGNDLREERETAVAAGPAEMFSASGLEETTPYGPVPEDSGAGLEENGPEETVLEEAVSEETSRDDISSAGNTSTSDTPVDDSSAGTDKARKQFTYQFYYHRRTGTYWMTGLDPFEDYEGNPFGEYPRRGAFAELVRLLGGTFSADRRGGSWKIGSSTWNASVKTIRTAGSPYTYSGIRMTRNGNTTYLDQVPEAFEGTGATAAGRPFSIHDLIRMLGVRITINQREMTAVMFPDAGDAE